MKKRRIRLAFIGAGGVAAGHYKRMMDTGQVDLVALVDPSQTSLARFRERCPGSEGIPAFPEYRAMLESVALDGALILSPHVFHFDQIKTCLQRGLHVLSEKPLVCRSRDARTVIALAERTGKVLSLSYQRHYEPVFRYMRAEIAKGRIGDVQFVQALQAQEWLRLTRGTWRQRREISGGGQLHDSGSHLIDIVLWVTGLDAVEVFARGENFGTEVDVNAAISLKFSNGALGNLSIVGNAPTWHEDHSIVGSKGAFYLRQDGTLLLQSGDGKPRPVRLPRHTENPDSNFVKCILGQATTETPPHCGLTTLLATEAMWKSMATGRPVRPKPR
jgi:predicted dehydrogenase